MSMFSGKNFNLPKLLLATDQMIQIRLKCICQMAKQHNTIWKKGAMKENSKGAYKNVENLTMYVSLFKYLYYNYTAKNRLQ